MTPENLQKLARRLAIALALGIVSLHVLAALGNPVGTIEDDAVQILLARSLRHGSFALPDAQGVPVTDPLPGLSALLLVAVWFLEPHWGLFRALGLMSTAAAVCLTWLLARRLLSKAGALAAALLVALSQVLVGHAGLVMPDIPLLALSLVLITALPAAESGPGLMLLGLGAAWAGLLRPQGALLAVCLAAAVTHRHGFKRAAAFYLPAFLPLAAWMLRNRLLAGTLTGYAVNWRSQVALLGEPAFQIDHAARIFASFFGEGLLALTDWSFAARLTLALAVVVLAGVGAARLMLKDPARVFTIAAYVILVLALHLTWVPVQPRYVILMIPFLWIFLIAAAEPFLQGRATLALTLLIFLGGTALKIDVDHAQASLEKSTSFQPGTVAWIKEHTLPAARFESFKYNSLSLCSERAALPPPLEIQDAEQWFASARANRIDYLHLETVFNPGGFLPPNVRFLAANLEKWARANPNVSEVYRNPEEKTLIFRLH